MSEDIIRDIDGLTYKVDLYTQYLLVMSKSTFTRKKNAYIAQVMNYAVIIWPDKAFYIGAVDDANLIEGTYYYLDGDYYAGEYKNNMMNGKGTYYYSTYHYAMRITGKSTGIWVGNNLLEVELWPRQYLMNLKRLDIIQYLISCLTKKLTFPKDDCLLLGH